MQPQQDALTTLMNDEQLSASYSQRAVAHFKKNFIWKDLLSRLAIRIGSLLKNNT
ncbi:hypothetical protein [Holophaga foetida]|uniref:hypothetical protein n=1 Tax=Holophaga foetida TaxID=35839 RepID=UPI0002473B3E|nr:hypothetical protein [Holophaga foetida]